MNNLFSKIKISIKNTFSQKVSYKKGGISPASDWSLILFSTVVIIIILIGVSLFFYFEIEKGEIFVVDDTSKETEVKINTALLKKVVDDLKEREVKFNELKLGKNIPSDPSL